jgi:hypothetical protein
MVAAQTAMAAAPMVVLMVVAPMAMALDLMVGLMVDLVVLPMVAAQTAMVAAPMVVHMVVAPMAMALVLMVVLMVGLVVTPAVVVVGTSRPRQVLLSPRPPSRHLPRHPAPFPRSSLMKLLDLVVSEWIFLR